MLNELSKAGDTENQIGRLVLGATAPLPRRRAMNPTGWLAPAVTPEAARYEAHDSKPVSDRECQASTELELHP